ncbi:MAG: hypothetical protein QM820_57205 [Minicystis sp.]
MPLTDRRLVPRLGVPLGPVQVARGHVRSIVLQGTTILLALAGCKQPHGVDETGQGGSGAGGSSACAPDDGPQTPPNDPLTPTRLLRRIRLVLGGQAPTAADYQALLAAKDDDEREAILDGAIDDALAAKGFYHVMKELGREWIAVPAIPAVADEPDYMGSQMHNIAPCPSDTPYAGALSFWSLYAPGKAPCSGTEADGTPALYKQIEPWWAPGTTVAVIGRAADDTAKLPITGPNGPVYDCGIDAPENINGATPACGCGPNLVYCHPSPVAPGYANWPIYVIGNPDGQRRMLWEEPARLVAHLAWYDRPLTDIILGDYSVGPRELQAAYVRAGRRTGAVELDQDESWWRPEAWTTPVDPDHDAKDPAAWREFTVSKRNPHLLSDRDYKFDPRKEPRGSMKGVPAAGALTMIGMLGAYPRERVRAARMLEMFACEAFAPPPATATFNKYENDPATQGPCQTCHTRIDPAAIHFKRFAKIGADIDLDHGAYMLLGVGQWTFDDVWTKGDYPYGGDPFAHWNQWWKPERKLTPVSAADAEANPEVRFIDYLPPEQTLLGQTSDGTVGPLGFAKMVVASGAFDRCAVRRLHERFGGRTLDPASEAGYIEALAQKFVAGGRKVRPFLRELMKSETFRRGL